MRRTMLTLPLLAAVATALPFTAATAATGPDVDGLDPLGIVPGVAVPAAAPAAGASNGQAAVEVRDNSFSPSRI